MSPYRPSGRRNKRSTWKSSQAERPGVNSRHRPSTAVTHQPARLCTSADRAIRRLSRYEFSRDGDGNLITVTRTGTRYHHDPNAALPIPFRVVVVRREYQESLGQGLSVYQTLGLFSRYPISCSLQLLATGSRKDFIRSHISEFHPFASWTEISCHRERSHRIRKRTRARPSERS